MLLIWVYSISSNLFPALGERLSAFVTSTSNTTLENPFRRIVGEICDIEVESRSPRWKC